MAHDIIAQVKSMVTDIHNEMGITLRSMPLAERNIYIGDTCA